MQPLCLLVACIQIDQFILGNAMQMANATVRGHRSGRTGTKLSAPGERMPRRAQRPTSGHTGSRSERLLVYKTTILVNKSFHKYSTLACCVLVCDTARANGSTTA